MNAKVGSDNKHYERIIGRHGLGVRNDNGERLCEMCDLNELVITGTLFPHKNIHKETWISPNGTTRNQIDHVSVNRRFRNSVKDTRVFRSADIGRDHLLVCTTVKLRLRKQCKEKRCERVKYDIEKLKDADTDSTAVLDKNGNLISGKAEALSRWTEHWKPQDPITEDDEVELDDIFEEISVDMPSIEEVQRAIKKLRNGESPGIDSITAELIKADTNFSSTKIHELMEAIWREEQIPDSWKKGLIMKLPIKGNLKECKNSRGITLLSVVGKLLGRIIIDRIREGIDIRLRKEQAGYRKGRSTTQQVFILRNIIEQVNEWQATLYLNFIDFEKAFDSIHRESRWTIMRKYRVSDKIVSIVRLFYEDFQCAVENQGETGEWFNIKTGVKQQCNMSGFIFLVIMDWVIRKAVGNGENGIRWSLTTKMEDLDFTDDISLFS
ncbi:uncharacterized protein LOC132545315 [Ylistrum balloti]|uniref:uncharacterized protein LOC132545315 n=1 Tax=Ylistrum balloti TaxID=509963 RepID=UPI0029059F52|nr:uncharacterized protein LOC132545315 [Ylistrum balloti]